MNICVIPARGGSKRIPRKNIKEFCGKPMIAWSIEAAIESGCFDRIIVSTDDAEIADVAEKFGAAIPFMRPAELADDYKGIIPAIAHAINRQNDHDDAPSNVCCICATAPFVQAKDIKRSLNLLASSGADFAFSITSFAFQSSEQSELLKNIEWKCSSLSISIRVRKTLMRLGMMQVNSIGENLWHGWKKKGCLVAVQRQ